MINNLTKIHLMTMIMAITGDRDMEILWNHGGHCYLRSPGSRDDRSQGRDSR
jgi:hypothetical protein